MENNFREAADRYVMLYDLHTHTIYSHGKGTVEDNVRQAMNKSLEFIAVSDHGPGHLFYGINRNEIVNMRSDIERMNVKYQNLNVRLSVEANIIRDRNGLDVREEEFEEFDFVIAGYHYGLFGCSCVRNWLWSKGIKIGEESLRKANTKMVTDALRKNNIAILTHPGDKGPFDIRELARVCAETDTLMEINTWHGHMTAEEIRIAAEEENVKFIISSDAHTPDRVGDFKEGVVRALEAGLDLKRIVNIKEKR
ncbi:MAG TPA: PHP domain-containing protein [Candidatus Copromorpha excrementigallinarum]|uniref:PHP domain-containing protein n=1 Tax=Candidatus Allocopromorpha excrementigallinarum TaxID=2840742 RepID=A0A9D1I089_9FIRM|nr:PHP domain-containing protein [Candidatus Copromorpha excrementigallinarum]